MSINAVDAKNKLDAETRQINIRRRDQKMEWFPQYQGAGVGLGDTNRAPTLPMRAPKSRRTHHPKLFRRHAQTPGE